jgi:hypothetical protein
MPRSQRCWCREARCTARWACANADLQAGAILDLGSDEPPDGLVDIGRRRVRQFARRLVVVFDDAVDLIDVDAIALTEHIGKAFGYLHDDRPGALDVRPVPDIGSAKVEPVPVVQGRALMTTMSTGSMKRR